MIFSLGMSNRWWLLNSLIGYLNVMTPLTKKLKATRGPLHDYLGMKIDFSQRGLVKFDMVPYIGKIIDSFPEKVTGLTSSPAADHLFKVRPPSEAKFFPEEQAVAFHHTAAQFLFLSRV